ncbi:MAG: hypothetical protein F6K14_33305 [Symploca sp. SIO2C1]|nr:hypothetical protein [Symploca sp. SIO2C1]
MFGTRALYFKSDKIQDRLRKLKKRKSDTQGVREYPTASFLLRLYQQGKQISQIIAYIWRWADEDCDEYKTQREVAKQLKEYFTGLEQNILIHRSIKRLFEAGPSTNPKEWELLRAVFDIPKDGDIPPGYIFPIFDEFELGKNDRHGYFFQVTPNDFNGGLMDPHANSPEFMRFVIPYPPCPVFGDTTVKKETLEKWIKNRDSKEFFAANTYIPTTCC